MQIQITKKTIVDTQNILPAEIISMSIITVGQTASSVTTTHTYEMLSQENKAIYDNFKNLANTL
jgi:hypothetical protein